MDFEVGEGCVYRVWRRRAREGACTLVHVIRVEEDALFWVYEETEEGIRWEEGEHFTIPGDLLRRALTQRVSVEEFIEEVQDMLDRREEDSLKEDLDRDSRRDFLVRWRQEV